MGGIQGAQAAIPSRTIRASTPWFARMAADWASDEQNPQSLALFEKSGLSSKSMTRGGALPGG